MVKRQTSKSWTSAAAQRLLALADNPSSVQEAVRIVVGRILDGVSSPPTDLDAIKPRLNIIEIIAEDIPIQGELRPSGKGFKLIHSKYLNSDQRRFTIAHEMGHAIFETSGRNCPRTGVELERLCDMLATEILLPTEKFSEYLCDNMSVEKIFELKRIFKASLSSTAIRCAELRQMSVFEVDGYFVNWGYGFIRKNHLNGVDGTIRRYVEGALKNASHQCHTIINNTVWNATNSVWKGPWQLEWKHLGQGERALFLLQPVRRPNNYSVS